MNPNEWWWRLVRFGFHLLYNELAFTYDWVSRAVSLGQWHCWQKAGLKHLNTQPPGDVLELAHGTGDIQLDLNAAGYHTVGVDLSPYMGRIAHRKLRRRGIMPRLVRCRAEALPFAPASFDAIIATFPTDFIVQPATLHETYRVLKPGGRLVVVINGVLTSRGVLTRLLEWLYRITGQRNTSTPQAEISTSAYEPFIERFDRIGYTSSIVLESCGQSVSVLIVAQKPAQPGSNPGLSSDNNPL